MLKLARLAGFILCGAVALAAAGGEARAATDHVSLRLDWKLTGYQVPFYWAKDKGYLAAENLDVDIKEGAGSGTTIDLIGGEQDDIGLADYLLMAAAAAKGMKVKAVYGIVQDGAWAVISYADHPIRTPQELAGKSIAATADHKKLLDLFMAVNQVPAEKVTVRVTSAATRNTVFAAGQVDGMVSIVIGSPMDLVVRANHGKGKPLYFMPFENFNVAPLGEGLIANDAYIAQHPDILRRFLRATSRAIADIVKPAVLDDAVAIAVKGSGTNPDRTESVKLQLADTIRHLHTKNTQAMPFGWMSDADWVGTLDILHKTGELQKEVPASAMYTNDFVPQ